MCDVIQKWLWFSKTQFFSQFPNTVIGAINITTRNSEYPLVGSVYKCVIQCAQCTPFLEPPTLLGQSPQVSTRFWLECPISNLAGQAFYQHTPCSSSFDLFYPKTKKLLSLLQLSMRTPVQSRERQSNSIHSESFQNFLILWTLSVELQSYFWTASFISPCLICSQHVFLGADM